MVKKISLEGLDSIVETYFSLAKELGCPDRANWQDVLSQYSSSKGSFSMSYYSGFLDSVVEATGASLEDVFAAAGHYVVCATNYDYFGVWSDECENFDGEEYEEVDSDEKMLEAFDGIRVHRQFGTIAKNIEPMDDDEFELLSRDFPSEAEWYYGRVDGIQACYGDKISEDEIVAVFLTSESGENDREDGWS